MVAIADVRRIAAGSCGRIQARTAGVPRSGRPVRLERAQAGRSEEAARSCLEILAVHCPIERKEMLIEAAPDIYFDDNHYRGYPALLVRLDAVGEAELAALMADACAEVASKPKRKRKPAG
jgi:hypothetical protein